MEKGKVKDFLAAIREEGIEVTLEDFLPELIENVGDVVTTEGASLFLGSVIGAVAPRVNGIRLNWLERRFERNIKVALQIMQDRIEQIEMSYVALCEEMQEKFRGLYVEWLMDNLYAERQPEKVEYHVNGFINMIGNDTNDNIMLMFMETLNQLTELDIDVLKIYSLSFEENWLSVLDKYKITVDQLSVIKEKLVRFGFLYSMVDDLRDSNIDAMAQYLLDAEKEAKKPKPRQVKMKDVKKPRKSES